MGLLCGPVVDAIDRRKLVLLTSTCLALVSAAFAVQAFAGLDLLWLLYALVAVQPRSVPLTARRVTRRARPAAAGAACRRGGAPGELPAHADRRPRTGRAHCSRAAPGLARVLPGRPVSFTAGAVRDRRLPAMRPSGGTARPGPRAVAEGIGFIRRAQVMGGAFLADLGRHGLPCRWPCSRRSTPNGSAVTPARCGLFTTAIGAGGLVSAALSGPVGHIVRQGRAMPSRSLSGARPSPASRSLPAWADARPARRGRSGGRLHRGVFVGRSSRRSLPIGSAAG